VILRKEKKTEYPGGLAIPSDTQKNINDYPGGLAIPSDTQKRKTKLSIQVD
jgi:hypothetical protein